MHRTQCPVRTGKSVKFEDILASCKVGPYTFLVHRSKNAFGSVLGYVASYAPVGLRAGNAQSSIQAAIDHILSVPLDRVTATIESTVRQMEALHWPLLAPETGIESVMDWCDREQYRFDTGEYQPLPKALGLEYPREHYVHLSVTKQESDFIAYTPSVEYGERDRQVRTKFGKYLRKTFEHLSDKDIQALVNRFKSELSLAEQPATLLFATDRETINEIFETEMCACDSTYTSCMHGKFAKDAIRPYHVYADSPDVAVAYVRAHGRIMSRSVVSTKDKEWVRTYSVKDGDSATDCEVLKTLLKDAGYSKGDLLGCRLTNLNYQKRGPVMLPYIDHGGLGVRDAGQYWVVCDEDEGDYNANQTDGTASECGPRCDCCERSENDCECIYCECCEERYTDGCDRCFMCPICDQCTEHDNCSCSRCSHCGELLSVPSRHRHTVSECECERCSECAELVRDCECVKCEECGELEENCECEEDSEDTEESTEEATA